jgi:hypothetical protein
MRLFVLLDWSPALGVAADPAGVLGMDDSTGTAAYLSWIPQIVRTGGGWRSRLTAPPAMAAVTSWLADEGSCQLAEIPVPAGAPSLPDAVEAAVDMLLAEVIPFLPPREAR